jgi:hypothetical protein
MSLTFFTQPDWSKVLELYVSSLNVELLQAN